MLCNCSSLVKLDIANFKIDNATHMGKMLSGCSSLKNR